MRQKFFNFIFLSVGLFLLTSCQSVLTPRLVLWHTWEGEQAQVINSAVNRFGEIFDDVVVVASYVPPDDLIERYMTTAEQGLGPDIFIAPNTALRELADAGLIKSLPEDTLNPALYYTASLATATYQDQLYAVPFAMRPLAMYYNLDLIDNPATTLSELIIQAEAGTGVAINTQFRQILWGVQAYGGQLLDDEGRIILNQGAFTNWLNWLLNANANPQIFLSRDTTTLRRLFFDERVAYYTGSASELPTIREQMGTDNIGVVPLPAGPNGASGPLMQADLLMFNPSSAPSVQTHAIDLAIFLTNLEQANTFMRDLQLVPANRRVRVDLRTYPAIAGFIAQTRTAVTVPYLPQVTRLLEEGDDILLQVLEGVIDPNTASSELTTLINSEFGYDTVEGQTTCDLSGQLILWHSLTNSANEYLSNVATRLNRNCARFTLNTTYVPATDIISAYIQTYNQEGAPDILLTSTTNLQTLFEANVLSPVDRERMQAFSPIAQSTVSLDGVAYGMPIALSGNVFYYNRETVTDAPVTTDELLVEALSSFSLARSVDTMLWTLTAYNGIAVVDDEIIPDEDQLTSWLTWLRQVREAEHINIAANQFLRESEFIQGQSVYYVGSSRNLSDLSLAMGETLSVAPFPTGTSPFASPLVTSLALFTNPASDNIETATSFASLLTDAEEQENMAEQLRWVPANTTADESLDADPLLAIIADVLQNGIVINTNTEDILSEVSRAIDRAFRTDQAVEEIALDVFVNLTESEATE